MTYHYYDAALVRHRTYGRFIGWQLTMGNLAEPLAVFQRRASKLWIPRGRLCAETVATLPPLEGIA